MIESNAFGNIVLWWAKFEWFRPGEILPAASFKPSDVIEYGCGEDKYVVPIEYLLECLNWAVAEVAQARMHCRRPIHEEFVAFLGWIPGEPEVDQRLPLMPLADARRAAAVLMAEHAGIRSLNEVLVLSTLIRRVMKALLLIHEGERMEVRLPRIPGQHHREDRVLDLLRVIMEARAEKSRLRIGPEKPCAAGLASPPLKLVWPVG